MPEMVTAARWFCATRPYQLVARHVVLPWVMDGLRPTGDALEIGAGSGAMSAQLLAEYPTLRVLATDYDPDMLIRARKNLSAYADRAAVQQVDAGALPFNDNRFDLVLSFAMLHHVGDWPGAVGEAMRVLRPGGQFIGYDALDGPLTRLLHWGEGDAVRMLRRGQLDDKIAESAAEVRIRTSLAGLAVRFQATKAR